MDYYSENNNDKRQYYNPGYIRRSGGKIAGSVILSFFIAVFLPFSYLFLDFIGALLPEVVPQYLGQKSAAPTKSGCYAELLCIISYLAVDFL